MRLFTVSLVRIAACVSCNHIHYCKPVPLPRGGLLSLRPQTKLQAPPIWNMKHCKLVEFLSIWMSSPPLHERKDPPHNRKASLLTTFWRRFCCRLTVATKCAFWFPGGAPIKIPSKITLCVFASHVLAHANLKLQLCCMITGHGSDLRVVRNGKVRVEARFATVWFFVSTVAKRLSLKNIP